MRAENPAVPVLLLQARNHNLCRIFQGDSKIFPTITRRSAVSAPKVRDCCGDASRLRPYVEAHNRNRVENGHTAVFCSGTHLLNYCPVLGPSGTRGACEGLKNMVELVGIEPTTSSLRTMRSPS